MKRGFSPLFDRDFFSKNRSPVFSVLIRSTFGGVEGVYEWSVVRGCVFGASFGVLA